MPSKIKPLVKAMRARLEAVNVALVRYEDSLIRAQNAYRNMLGARSPAEESELLDAMLDAEEPIAKATKGVDDAAKALKAAIVDLENRLEDKKKVSLLKKLNPFRKLNVQRAKTAIKNGRAYVERLDGVMQEMRQLYKFT